MSYISDVAIAIKNDVYDQLTVRTKLFIQEYFTEEDHIKEGDDAGRLFHCYDIKWYISSDNEISRLYQELDDIDQCGEEFLIVEACHDCPESDEGSAGDWYDNPWGVYKDISVSISWSK